MKNDPELLQALRAVAAESVAEVLSAVRKLEEEILKELLETTPNFRVIHPGELKLGDKIYEREGRKTVVTTVTKLSPCQSKRGCVHVNRNYCYDRIATLLVE